MFAGLGESPARHLARQFPQDGSAPVMVTNIPFTSMCEHHPLPFSGVAHIAYQPQHGRVVCRSKLARTVQILARRPQQQERLTQQVRTAIEEHIDPAGVLVMLEATHSCMQIRGAKAHGAAMKTRSVGSRWERDAATRREIQEMMAGKSFRPFSWIEHVLKKHIRVTGPSRTGQRGPVHREGTAQNLKRGACARMLKRQQKR